MEITVVVISILALAGLVWLIRKFFKLKICPICAGVFLTWLWLLIGLKLGWLDTSRYQLVAAILMGGTVVGLMTKLEPLMNTGAVLFWKTIFVSLGFLVVYGLIISNWLLFAVSAGLAVIATFIFKARKNQIQPKEANELEKKMKNCC